MMKTLRKNRVKKALVVCGASALMLMGCDKEDAINPLGGCFGGAVWTDNILDELTEWEAAAQAYSDNPTDENCNRYKEAAKDYLDSLRGMADCVPGTNRAEYDQAIKEAKEEVDREGCD
ncbi:hypothetical protein [Maribacter thermophilus]|uniref:hypothetical protein n=1 Tax=Maribacter thermophilus TaxID=1197874 RepID=UPI0012F9896B|nr:hypothetical protein [Maribacter thermophilus]